MAIQQLSADCSFNPHWLPVSSHQCCELHRSGSVVTVLLIMVWLGLATRTKSLHFLKQTSCAIQLVKSLMIDTHFPSISALHQIMTILLETAGILSVGLEVSNEWLWSLYIHMFWYCLIYYRHFYMVWVTAVLCGQTKVKYTSQTNGNIYQPFFWTSDYHVEKKDKDYHGITSSMHCVNDLFLMSKMTNLGLLQSQCGYVYLNNSPHW